MEFGRHDDVEGIRSEVLGTSRFVDPLTVGAIIVTVTVAVKGTSSLTGGEGRRRRPGRGLSRGAEGAPM